MEWIQVGIIVVANTILLLWTIFQRKKDKKILQHK